MSVPQRTLLRNPFASIETIAALLTKGQRRGLRRVLLDKPIRQEIASALLAAELIIYGDNFRYKLSERGLAAHNCVLTPLPPVK